MRYLKRYLESFESEKISMFDSEGWKKFLPDELTILTNDGRWILKRPDEDYGMGHATNIMGHMNGIQINYVQNTAEHGDVTRDGEPDQLEFDIDITKNNDGTSANPETLKLDVDITYGDAMKVEFSIEKPNRISVGNYNGLGSKYDPDTFFGFEDDSLKAIVDFFNSWGYELTVKDFAFIDKYPDSYVHTNEDITLNPGFDDKYVLVVNNSVPPANRYLDNLLKYLNLRGLQFKIASTASDVEKFAENFDIMCAISTGSEYRYTKGEGDKGATEAAMRIGCPVYGICWGFQILADIEGGEVVDSGKFVHGTYEVSSVEHPLFEGLDMENAQFSFSCNDDVSVCPNGFEVLARLDDRIVAIGNEDKRFYGSLFHPEDIEYTQKVLDNFIAMCDGGRVQDVEDLKGNNKVKKVIDSFESFKNKK
jgi:GMP synthase-like glutamine amidotransferase